ncbi:hypothetical protein [Actinopolyspora mortivallis]|uniref:Uncharacterized protein n=1 Tax=Actinopolyspora mortivallis TaxID=33906 RepID=A0A2T0H0J6_ACTMO|nr:hypothetical protein [Actinopolyspora mortivallis]PRW64879.1 hypothetical protein CEP50_03440 [Actinopolyspora mortivallis]
MSASAEVTVQVEMPTEPVKGNSHSTVAVTVKAPRNDEVPRPRTSTPVEDADDVPHVAVSETVDAVLSSEGQDASEDEDDGENRASKPSSL